MSASKSATLEVSLDDTQTLLQQFRQQLTRDKRRVVVIQTSLLVISVVFWELLVRFGVLQELFIGQPTRVGGFVLLMIADGSLLDHARVTVIETVGGFVLGFAGGAVCGLLLWWSKMVARVLDPIMVALNSLPKIALTPIFLVWFGVGLTMKVALSLSTVFLVTFLTAAASLGSIDRELVQLTEALGGNRWQIFRKVVIPSSVPWLISAMKISIGFGLTGAVVGEFVAANKGIGFLLLYAAQLYEMSLVWAGIFILVVIAVAMYMSVALLERLALRWRES